MRGIGQRKPECCGQLRGNWSCKLWTHMKTESAPRLAKRWRKTTWRVEGARQRVEWSVKYDIKAQLLDDRKERNCQPVLVSWIEEKKKQQLSFISRWASCLPFNPIFLPISPGPVSGGVPYCANVWDGSNIRYSITADKPSSSLSVYLSHFPLQCLYHFLVELFSRFQDPIQ